VIKPRNALIVATALFVFSVFPVNAQWGAGKPITEAKKPSVGANPLKAETQQKQEKWNKASYPESPAFPQGEKELHEEGTETAAPTILHEPVKNATQGQGVNILANILDKSGVKAAHLHYKSSDDVYFRTVPMNKGIDGNYKAQIPPRSARSGDVAYYVEATDLLGNGPARLGSPKEPLVIHLDPPFQAGATTNRHAQYGAAVFAVLFALVLTIFLRERFQRSRTLDSMFWAKKLIPLLHLPAEKVTAKITKMSQSPLLHPVYGEKVFPRILILKRLDQVKRMNLHRLVDRKDKYVARYMDVL
jgi:hypothetical protein